jgi:glycine/D-amino acid oxidase-like deaminating enzyme
VLEATRIGGGTSGISFAWTNAHKKPPRPYHDLNVAGMKAHAALANEFGATPWWHGGGSLEWEAEPDRPAQRENIEQLRSWGYAAEWITLREVQELEPDIDPATIGEAPVAFFPQEGWLDPVVYAHAMLSAARLRHGAKIICGTWVVDLIVAADRVTGVSVARIGDGFLFSGRTQTEAVQIKARIEAKLPELGRDVGAFGFESIQQYSRGDNQWPGEIAA